MLPTILLLCCSKLDATWDAREGLAFCPDSAVLKSLAEKEGASVVPEAGKGYLPGRHALQGWYCCWQAIVVKRRQATFSLRAILAQA